MAKSLPWQPLLPPPAPSRYRARRLVARLLRWLSRGLAMSARRLAASEPYPSREPVLEFYAEAGAPEGALFVDGQRVGVLPGVTRL